MSENAPEWIDIPFRADMRAAVLNHEKFCTSRTRRYGKPGDKFKVDGVPFRLLAVEDHTLMYVAARLYLMEGCANPSDFIAVWHGIHPRQGFAPDQHVWVHFFVPEE